MNRFDWMLLKAYVPRLFTSLAIILFILVLQLMAAYMNQIFGKGIGLVVLGKLVFYATGKLVILALPLAVLASALMTLGGMGENYELAAIKSSGVSLLKAVRSLLVFSIFLTAFGLWFSFFAVPEANLKFFSLLYDVQRKKADVALKPGYFYSDIEGYVIRISDKDERGMLYDILIYDHTENRGNARVLLADSGRMVTEHDGQILKMKLYHGSRHEEMKPRDDDPDDYPYGRSYFDSLYFSFNLSGFDLRRTDEALFSRHQITLKQWDLAKARDSLGVRAEEGRVNALAQINRYTRLDSNYLEDKFPTPTQTTSYQSFDLGGADDVMECFTGLSALQVINQALVQARAVKSYLEFRARKMDEENVTFHKYSFEFYKRIALPFNAVIFLLIGVSFGAIIRKGGLGPSALISIIFFVIFWVVDTYAYRFTSDGIFDPLLGAFLSVIAFAPIALAVMYQANTDAKILDQTAWRMFFEKQIRRLKQKIGGAGKNGSGG